MHLSVFVYEYFTYERECVQENCAFKMLHNKEHKKGCEKYVLYILTYNGNLSLYLGFLFAANKIHSNAFTQI